ncbi:hypothetical protein BDA96_07G050200 [Sorghum bicolor]|uniref:Uncharacterized protein n=2 Tax=Sorghum bicolor TaxID=4558 RepID=A0A921QIJ8_SORBI|nr:hypothetical protein BDA96_07G050200 [Sorghum bicolor]KXG24480.2 hypothetical protein SORBI_3007G047450 [Sorghum bicolor]
MILNLHRSSGPQPKCFLLLSASEVDQPDCIVEHYNTYSLLIMNWPTTKPKNIRNNLQILPIIFSEMFQIQGIKGG